MKKVSFLVAFLAVMQVTLGQQIAQGQQRVQDRRTVEEALDLAGEDIGDELEEFLRQLEATADQLGTQLEDWAEENSDELEAWSEKYAGQWESWGEQFEQKIERLAGKQEAIWGKWAQRYERNLEQWADELDSDEFEPKQFSEFVERNLKMLSKMPVGQLVDQALEEGLGELSDAPWESLEELGALASDALEEPLHELAEIFDVQSDERRALDRGARELSRALERLHDDIGRNISDDDQVERVRDARIDPRIRALQDLRHRENITADQLQRIDDLIRTIQDADHLRTDRSWRDQPRIDVPRRDQILEKIQREQKRHQEALQRFNEDLRRSSEESRKSDMKMRERDSRNPKGVDGKNLGGNSQAIPRSRENRKPRVNLGGREIKKPAASANRNRDSKAEAKKSDIELLRQEIEKLRREVQQLKKQGGK